MNDLNKRNDKFFGIKHGVQIGYNTLFNGFRRIFPVDNLFNRAVIVIINIIEGRNINALKLSGFTQKFKLCRAELFMLFQKVDKLVDNLFALARCENVDKISYRLGVAHARPARTYDRGQFGSVRTSDRQTRKVKHIEHIGIAHLILHGKAYHIKVLDTVATFKPVKRNIVFTHKLFHIVPRRKYPFAPRLGSGVYERIENFHTEMRHTYFVIVGKAKGISELDFIFILYNAVELSARISCRLLNALKQFFLLFRKHSLPLKI